MYIGRKFFELSDDGFESKAGTLIHETSHFTINGATDDYANDAVECMELARNNPSRAVMNADSHEYFAENDPHLD